MDNIILTNQLKNNELIVETSNLFQRFLFNFIPNLVKGTISLIFRHIPNSVYYFLSRTFTFSFQSYTLILFAILLIIILYIGYRNQKKYSKISKSKLNTEDTLFEYNTDQTYEIYDEKPIQTNYPNEFMNAFLASIKVFGYLDKPVFHELANQLQTRMLSKDEVLCRDKKNYSNDFITVVDGEVEVYIPKDSIGNGNKMVFNNNNNNNRRNSMAYRSNNNISVQEEQDNISDRKNVKIEEIDAAYDDLSLVMDEDELESKYYCLTKVKTGGTLTSLFVILSLLVNDDNMEDLNDTMDNNEDGIIDNNDIDKESINKTNELKDNINEALKSSFNDNKNRNHDLEYGEAMLSTFEYPTMYFKARKRTTLAVIPEKAFSDLKNKYPSAVSHIIQVILTRFQRVTFLTLYKYLGLTDELIEVEKKVNEFISGGHLPQNFFPPCGLENVRKNIKHSHDHSKKNITKRNNVHNRDNTNKIVNDDDKSSKKNKPDSLKIQDNWSENEQYIKKSIYNVIAKYIGINENISYSTKSQQDYEYSPRYTQEPSLSPNFNDSNNNSQEFDPVDSSEFDLTEDRNKGNIKKTNSLESFNINNAHYPKLEENLQDYNTSNDYPSKIELLYYPRGSVLLNEGDKYKGLFFVIDGLIEGVSLNKDEGLFQMSINTPKENIQNNHIRVSSNKPKENIHLKAQTMFNKKMELNNRKRFNNRFINRYKDRLNNLIIKKSNPIESYSDSNDDLRSNDSRQINSAQPFSSNLSNYDRSDTGTLDGTTTELTFSTSNNKTLFYIKPGGLSCYFSILNGIIKLFFIQFLIFFYFSICYLIIIIFIDIWNIKFCI